MNAPKELAEYKLERAELVIALPADWKLNQESMQDERWYWPIRLLKALARLPIYNDTWLAWGHTMDNTRTFAKEHGTLRLHPGRSPKLGGRLSGLRTSGW